MKLADFNRLKKLMMMTTSDNDPECLQAIRASNTILKKNGYNWDSVFSKMVTVTNEFEEDPESANGTDDRAVIIENAFRVLDEGPEIRGGFGDFIESLREQWGRKKWLSPNQLEALLKAAARVNR